MAKLIGLDVGTKRVGVALSDESGKFASAYASFARPQSEAEQQLLSLIESEQVTQLVVGLPLSASGERTDQCEDVERFARRISRRTAVEVIYVDEHLSSEEAKQRLGIAEQPSPELRKKGVIDAEAASILLQSYLDGTLVPIPSE